jgi:hypothetical protein
VITPEVPTGDLIRQAVLHNQPHSQSHDAMGVMGLWQSVVRRVGVEVQATARAAVLGVDEMDVARSTGNQVAHVMQDSLAPTVAKTRFATSGTRPMVEIPTSFNDLRFGKILETSNALGGVREIAPGTTHSKALLGHVIWPRNLRDLLNRVMVNYLF